MDLKHCTIRIPSITDSLFKGSFFIDNDKFHFWIEWDMSNISFIKLFDIDKHRELFDAQIIASDFSSAIYTCFKCYFTSVIHDVIHQESSRTWVERKPFWGEKNIALECNSWIEGIHLDSLSQKFWNEVSFRFSFAEPWFPSKEINIEVPVSNDESIHFFVGEQQQFNYFPNTKSFNYNNQIIYQNKTTVFSVEEAVHIGVIIQTLLRYTSSIPLPPPSIEFIKKTGQNRIYSKFHGRFGIIGLSDYATTSQYFNMPLKLEPLINQQSVKRWIDFCKDDDLFSAVVNYCIGQNHDYINNRIVLLTRVFDKLSQTETVPYMKDEEFKSFLDNASKYIELESRGIFSRDRVHGLLSLLNKQTLKKRLLLVLGKMNDSIFKEQNDYIKVANYLSILRHADAHSGFADITKLPEGYDYEKVLTIIDRADRFYIDKCALGI